MEHKNTCQRRSKCFSILHVPLWHGLERATAWGRQQPRPTEALEGINFLLLFFGYFNFFLNLNVYPGPKYPSTHIFFFSLSWVLAPRCPKQGVFNALRQTPGDVLPRRCWTDGAREINSVNRVWAETIKSVVLVSLYGAERCPAQAAVGQLASCAGLRSPLLYKLACFSHFRRQALKQTEKPFSGLWQPSLGAGQRGCGCSTDLMCFVHHRHISG